MGADHRPVTAHGRPTRAGGSMEGRPARSPLVHRGSAWGLSSVGEHLLCKQGVTGSNPVASTICRDFAATLSFQIHFPQTAILQNPIYERARRGSDGFDHPIVRAQKAPHFFVARLVTSPQIEAGYPVILDSLPLQGTCVVMTIMSNYDPSPTAYFSHPQIIFGCLGKVLLMDLHARGQSQTPQPPGKENTDIPIEEKDRIITVRGLDNIGGSHSARRRQLIITNPFEPQPVKHIVSSQAIVGLNVLNSFPRVPTTLQYPSRDAVDSGHTK